MKNLGKVIFECSKGNVPTEYSTFTKQEREEAINKAFYEAIGVDASATKKEKKKALRANMHKVFAITEELVDSIVANIDVEDAFFSTMVDTRQADLGDSVEFYVEGGQELELNEFSGSHWSLKRSRIAQGEKFTISVKDYGVAIYEYWERLISDRADYSKLVDMLTKAVVRKHKEVAHTALVATFAQLPTELKYSGSYDKDAILEKVAVVEAGNQTKPVLVGTRQALAKLQGIETEAYGNERNAKGFNSTWEGYQCVELTNALKPNSYEFQLPVNEIYVVAGDEQLVKLVLEGSEMTRERSGSEMNDRSQETTLSVKIGCAVVYSGFVGHLVLA